MPYNELQVPDFGVERQRLTVLLDELTVAFKGGAFSTREELLQAWSTVIGEFRDTVGKAVFSPGGVKPDSAPDADLHNEETRNIAHDLSILFLRLKLLGENVVATFNQTAIEQDELVGRVRRVASKLADLELYQGSSGELVHEAFINLTGIDLGSNMLSDPQAEVVVDEGIVTLTQEEVINVAVDNIAIDSTSFNGALGNNEGVGIASTYSNLNAITDDNADTWTEFEKTYFLDQSAAIEPLSVNLLFTLAQPTIINRIIIDPVNFGTLDAVDILDISVSSNGQDWTSVKGSIPLANYMGETEEDLYILNPTSSLYSGKFTYSFLPHKAKHVSVRLRKKKAFIYPTTSGVDKYRVAIGIRGIDFKSIKYGDISEVISRDLSVASSIFKIAMLAAYRPVNSSLGSIEFSVSINQGQTWHPLQPMVRDSFDAPEVFTFEELQAVDSFIWRAVIKRDNDGFTSSESFQETEENLTQKSESIIVNPEINPALISPTETMASGVVSVLETVGSRGPNGTSRLPLMLGSGTGSELKLFTPFFFTDLDANELHVLVNGADWTYVGALSAYGSTDTVFTVVSEGGQAQILFGNGLRGKAVPSGASVEIFLDPELLLFDAIENGFAAKMDFSSDGVATRTVLERLGEPSSVVSAVLPRGQYTINLDHSNLIPEQSFHNYSFQIIERDMSGLLITSGTYQSPKASADDLAIAGDYFVDYINGVIISFSQSSPTNMTVVSYRYFPVRVITDFHLATAVNGFDKLVIPASEFVSDSKSDITGEARSPLGFEGYFFPLVGQENVSESTEYVIRLSQGKVLKGTLNVPDDLFANPPANPPVEVSYINGHDELHGNLVVSEEEIPDLAGGADDFFLQHGTSSALFMPSGVLFSRTDIFTTEVTSAPVSNGEYQIIYATGQIKVFTTGAVTDPGTVSYEYKSALINSDGRYSVDYDTGIIYCVDLPVDGKVLSYRYMLYRVKYNVGRVLPDTMFTVDVTANTISLETEQLFSGRVQYLYEYIPELTDNLVEVAPYYTPVLRDLRFRVLDQSIS